MHNLILINNLEQMREVSKADIKTITRAPQSELVLLADRYELNNGDIWWTKGNQGWYDEHVLQSKKSMIEVKGKYASDT